MTDTTQLIAAVKSLISDIESMQYQHESWFGPFTEIEEDENAYGDITVSVEWPNLRISLDAVNAELAKVPSDLIITDGIRVHGSERDLDWNEPHG